MKRPVNIAVIAPSEPAEFFDLLWDGISSAIFDLSFFGVAFRIFKTNGHNIRQQKKILAGLLRNPPDAIALIPSHVSLLDPYINELGNRGTHVITFNSDAPASNRAAFVGSDSLQAGRLAGEILAKMVGGRGRLVSFPGSPDLQNGRDRHEGFRAEIERWGGGLQEIVTCGKYSNLEPVAMEVFSRVPDAAGVYVGCSRVFQVAAAMERLNLKIPCVGFNNTEAVAPFLANRTVSAVIDESTHQQGYIAIQRAYEAAVGTQKAPARWVRIPSSAMFGSNCADLSGSESLNQAFEMLVQQRTTRLRSYQEMLEDANSRLQKLAETDPLTGVLNRRKFEDILEYQAHRSHEFGPLSLLMIDVDSFKDCNDRYGHPMGDEVLKRVARILEANLRRADFCARLGGDEFCLLLPETDNRTAHEIRSRILNAISLHTIGPQVVNMKITLSIGVATLPDGAATPEELIVEADRSMYGEKQKRRHRFTPMAQCYPPDLVSASVNAGTI